MRLALALLLAATGPAPAATLSIQGDAIVFDGRIDAETAARFRELARDPAVRRVTITSSGGLVGPALDIAEVLHERGLDVEVPAMCLSSCANYIFPAGRTKTIEHLLAVGWHGNMANVLHLRATGQGTQWSEGEMAQARELAVREAAFYRRIGVDGFIAWFGKLAPWNVGDFYALRPADMALFGLRDVQVRSGSGRIAANVQLLQPGLLQVEAARPPP